MATNDDDGGSPRRVRVDRRSVLMGGAAGAAALTAPRAANAQAEDQGKGGGKRPNIIYIMADDMGVADASCYGAPQIRTPHIDSLAEDGARFTQAYANSAVCSATRTALITGRYQYRLPIGLEEPLAGRPGIGLPPSIPTLPSQLRDAGYSTALIGKWHLGELPDFGPLKSGYQHFWGFRSGAVDYFSHKTGAGQPDLWDADTPISKQGYLTHLLGNRAVDFIRDHGSNGRPFFLSLHFNAPHWPWETSEDEDESQRLAKQGKGIADWDGGSLATYQRMVEEMDQQIGRVLKALKKTGEADDTIVIFTSDNGGERFGNTWPHSGKKTELLEGGLRVPAVVRWPARIKRGLVSDQVIATMDWLPTLLAAAGTKPADASPPDGRNLLPVLTERAQPSPRTLFWRYKANGQRAVRDGDYKALKIGPNTFLFNVVDDPLERANLKDRKPEIYKRLTSAWNEWNRTMLPEDPRSFTGDFDGSQLADHILTPVVDPKVVDDGDPGAW